MLPKLSEKMKQFWQRRQGQSPCGELLDVVDTATPHEDAAVKRPGVLTLLMVPRVAFCGHAASRPGCVAAADMPSKAVLFFPRGEVWYEVQLVTCIPCWNIQKLCGYEVQEKEGKEEANTSSKSVLSCLLSFRQLCFSRPHREVSTVVSSVLTTNSGASVYSDQERLAFYTDAPEALQLPLG